MTTTETAAPRFQDLESWDTASIVDAMVEGQLAAVSAVYAARLEIARAVDEAALRLTEGGRLIYLGAGTSGRIATLDAAELWPTFCWPRERALAVMAGGSDAFSRAIEGAEDDVAAGPAALDRLGLGRHDVVIGLAASGRTPFVVSALRHARGKGALTIALYNNPEGSIAEVADIAILAATGPEVVAGSTRMKAGTAQKAALTCLSSGIFVKLGYVYRGRMVEMVPTNAKLHRRAIEMVADIAQVSPDRAREALEASGHSIKCAIVMLVRTLDATAAKDLLDRVGGRLHAALAGD